MTIPTTPPTRADAAYYVRKIIQFGDWVTPNLRFRTGQCVNDDEKTLLSTGFRHILELVSFLIRNVLYFQKKHFKTQKYELESMRSELEKFQKAIESMSQ
ncbi:MAG: hypothetical protein PWQ50_1876 [Methanolobus sp.]|jgi:hypothetical protein|nr:hypothetical protein [Methanolobus sp.]